MARDLDTERSRRSGRELDLERDPELLAVLGDELGHGVFTLDGHGRFVAWSRGAERITGYTRAEVAGQPCRLLEGPSCKGFSGLVELLRSSDPAHSGMRNRECRVLTKDGRELHILGSALVLRDEDGSAYGAVGSFLDVTELLAANAPAAAAGAAAASTALLGRDLDSAMVSVGFVGRSRAMLETYRRIRLAADSDVTTLITGESGTGKELAARAIHVLSDRRDAPFVATNCSAIPETLLESELFGHAEGAFTGAVRDRAGVFESADGGTLFLDEIGDVSPVLQLKLLRVLQEREVRRVGEDTPRPIDVRLLTATNRDLAERVESGDLREDFFYRVRVFEIRMPPLRERTYDVPLLARRFLDEIAAERGRPALGIAQDALEALVRYPWPGNVRELRNAIEYGTVVQRGDVLGLLDLPESVRGGARGRSRAFGERDLTPDQEAERLRILKALEDHGWNRTRTAQALGISRVTLWKRIRRYQLDEGVFKRGTSEELGRG
jgi:PAS domain S-box-containing protein